MYNGLLHAHSGLRWIALLLLIATIIISFTAKNKPYSPTEKKLALFTLISFHLQLLIGFYLYFTSSKVKFFEGFMKDSLARFFNVEHIFGMLIAILLITMGYSKAKRKSDDLAKRKTIKKLFLIALIIILVTIPWPFREALGGKWF